MATSITIAWLAIAHVQHPAIAVEQVMLWILLTIVPAFVALWVFVGFEDPTRWLFAQVTRLFSIYSRAIESVTGFWHSEYDYPVGLGTASARQLIELKQIGPYVIGSSITHCVHEFEVFGKIKNAVFTGHWHNIRGRNVYHGAFQFLIKPDGQQLVGKWLGFSDTSKDVAVGTWTLTFYSKIVRGRQRRETVSRYNVGQSKAAATSSASASDNDLHASLTVESRVVRPERVRAEAHPDGAWPEFLLS